ncbi:hypothetical protein IAI10_19735 [Clostridium sp. 19966]|uniref:hypothetical protein n=1 Tax=Clostridium sp. 19966 TaxID=2768166 RepID=UPI0028DDCBAE|nr:hypothetical protein [Clostridium sp. 19966]MDT8718887.1 hypothetical protein [Clostridium sp. 19966]
MSKNLGGRPKKKSDKELLSILENYIGNHTGEKIILSELARETGVKRHIWDYSKKVRDIIEKINNPIIVVNEVTDELNTIPSVESIREQLSTNPKKVLEAYASCIRIINNLTEQAKLSYELQKKIEILEKQISDFKNENKRLLNQVTNQEQAMLELCISSESLKQREEKNLKNNIITIDANNIERAIAVTDEDIKAQFPWLND